MYASNRCLLIIMEWLVHFICPFNTNKLKSFGFSMEGGELFNRIRQRQDKPYTEREAANVILMIAKAVAHLHHMDMVGEFSFVFARITNV